MTTRYFKATFADGTVKIRSTTTRDYAAAWRFAYITSYGEKKRIERFGFSASAAQAAANLRSDLSGWRGFDGEVVACVPCTRKGEPITE